MAAVRIDWERHAIRLSLLAMAVGIIGIWWGGFPGIIVMLLAMGLFMLACVSREDGLLLFGPFVRYELIKIARRQRLALWRSIYAIIMLGVLAYIYGVFLNERGQSLWLGQTQLPIYDMAIFAGVFFGTYATIQFLTVLFLAPGFMSEVIAEEKERDRLHFLLATDLRNREIIFGKIASRVAFLLNYVLVGLPVLAILPLFGGVDPSLMVGVTLGTLITVMGITGIAIFATVFGQTVKQASSTVTGLMFLYMCVSGALWLIALDGFWTNFPSTSTWQSPVRIIDLVEWFGAGNPIAMMTLIGQDTASGIDFNEAMFHHLRRYATFHLIVLVLFGAAGVALLRPVAANQGANPTPKKKKAQRNEAGPIEPEVAERPPITDRPILWKEIHFTNKRRTSKIETFIWVFVILVSLIPIGFMIYLSDRQRGGTEAVNMLVRVVTAAVSMVFMMHSASIGARSIARERDKQTYEALILTGIEPREILWQKWLGAFISSRQAFYWLSANWLVAMLLGGLNPLAIPFLVLALFIYNAFAVSVGVWCSVQSPTAERANRKMTWTLMWVLALVVVTSILGQDLGANITAPLIFAELPFLTIGALAFEGREVVRLAQDNQFWTWVMFLSIGLAGYGFFARKFWRDAVVIFSKPPEAESKSERIVS